MGVTTQVANCSQKGIALEDHAMNLPLLIASLASDIWSTHINKVENTGTEDVHAENIGALDSTSQLDCNCMTSKDSELHHH